MQKLKDRGNHAVPPKKSASAYIIFGKEVRLFMMISHYYIFMLYMYVNSILQKRAEILKRNPMAKVTEVVKEIAQTWQKLGKDDRQKYKEAAKRGK